MPADFQLAQRLVQARTHLGHLTDRLTQADRELTAATDHEAQAANWLEAAAGNTAQAAESNRAVEGSPSREQTLATAKANEQIARARHSDAAEAVRATAGRREALQSELNAATAALAQAEKAVKIATLQEVVNTTAADLREISAKTLAPALGDLARSIGSLSDRLAESQSALDELTALGSPATKSPIKSLASALNRIDLSSVERFRSLISA